jgi:hypothetical protein
VRRDLKFLRSATKSAVSYALSAPTVTCFVPGICSSITSAASRSAVPLASKTSYHLAMWKQESFLLLRRLIKKKDAQFSF